MRELNFADFQNENAIVEFLPFSSIHSILKLPQMCHRNTFDCFDEITKFLSLLPDILIFTQ